MRRNALHLLSQVGPRGKTFGLAIVLAAAAMGACARSQASTANVSPVAEPAATATPAEAPRPSPVHAAAAPVSGTVAETMEAASYTYVRLTTDQGDQWAAIPKAKLAVGDPVTIANPMVIEGFQSPSLKRRFDRILFGTLGGSTPAPSHADPHAGMSGMGAVATPELPPGPPVPRATGPDSHTVAEVFAGTASLKDKPVTLRGRVTKYNGGILGKNWVHVADGSAKAGAEPSIVVTTTDTAAPGDVVLVKGVVRADKDFGAGYAYPVMIEDATMTK